MNAIRIDRSQALELLRAVIEGRESHIYEAPPDYGPNDGISCFYSHGDQCGCLIGHALYRAGASMQQLQWMDSFVDDHGDSSIGVIHAAWLDLTDEARTIFSAAQSAQDNGATWGEAVAEALVAASRYQENADG